MEKQKNIPQLRFPEFDIEWIKYKLGDLSKSIQSGKDSNDSDGRFPLYGSMGIIGKSANPSYNGKFILVARVGANAGSINIVNGSFGVTDNTLIIDNEITIDTDFEYYLLTVANLNKYVFGSGQPLVTAGQLKALKLSIPVISEQQKIASFFTAIDEKITQLKQKKILLEQYKKGVMQKIFSQEIRFKDEKGMEFPEWETRVLGDLVVFRNGKGHEQDISENGEYIVVNSKFISTEGEVKKYTGKQICPLYYGEIVMVMSDIPNGKALAKCYFIEKDDKYTLNQRICALKTIVIEPRFLFYILNRNKYYLMFDSGVGQTNLAKNEVLDCPLTIPKSNIEQIKIANLLTSIDDKINHTQKQIDKAEVWKKGLMQQMFV